MEALNSHFTDDSLLSLIQWHTVDIYLLTLLAVGDLLTCLAILMVGFMRKNMYTAAMETGRVPIETSWSCAWKSFVLLRLLGSLISPCVVFWISMERFLAVFYPRTYRIKVAKYITTPSVIILLYTVGVTAIGYILAWHNRNNPDSAPFYCGRKVSFGYAFTSYVYAADVLGFVLALALNLITICKLAKMYAARKNRIEVQRQLRRIRYILVISLISTVTVAIPNAMSFISAWFIKLDIYLSEPAVWAIAFKCSINFFVYFILKADFRHRVYEMLGCLTPEDQILPKTEPVLDIMMRRRQSTQEELEEESRSRRSDTRTPPPAMTRNSIRPFENTAQSNGDGSNTGAYVPASRWGRSPRSGVGQVATSSAQLTKQLSVHGLEPPR
ncbi:serpentine type 7TM GPCR chemoreceptor srsx domain-containing protein [Ditylenchus destructor]|nr:serpentine type 7TM GPCR chemoreceptor srsx domain-containing protein [Ditylenchus destructor]